MRKNEIREILHRLDMERKKFLGPKLQVLGLTVGEGQARALRTLLEEGTMTQKQLADLCARIGENYPKRMNLPQQGSFQLGYYHQTQARYQKKEENRNV